MRSIKKDKRKLNAQNQKNFSKSQIFIAIIKKARHVWPVDLVSLTSIETDQ